MRIVINGEWVEVEENLNLLQWAQEQEIPLKTVIIEHNGQIIPEDGWINVQLQNEDQLEIFKFVGGG